MSDPIFDQLLDEQRQRKSALAGSLTTSVSTNPDAFATQKRVAGFLGYPAAAVEAMPDLAEQAKVLRVQNDIANAPALKQRYTDADFAKLAHDDSGVLSTIETSIARGVRYFMGATPSGGFLGTAKAFPDRAAQAAAGVKAMGADIVEPWARLISGKDNQAAQMSAYYKALARQAEARGDALDPPDDSVVGGGLSGGVNSLLQSSKYLPIALAGGPVGAAVALGGMVAETIGQSYLKADEKGLPLLSRLIYGISDGVVEYATEKGPLGALVHSIKAGTPLGKAILQNAGKEMKGEQIATALQDLNAWAALNPDKPFADYLAERPEAAAKTAIGVLVGAAGNTALTHSMQRSADMLAGRDRQVEYNVAQATALQEQLQMALNSKLRERSPDEFRAAVQAMADSAAEANPEIARAVFVDAEVLNQLPPEVQQLLPAGVLDQMAQALATGDAVEIPIGDALAIAPGTPLEQTLVEHGRIGDPSMPSQFETKQAGALAQQMLATEAQGVIQQAADAQAMQDSSDRVAQTILTQLQATGRFRQAVNEGYATWAAAFYTTMAGRVGLTPEEMQAKYPLRIVDQTGAGEVMDQGKPGELTVEGYHFSAAARSTLSTAFYGTGLKGSAREEILTHPDQRVAQRLSFYFDKGDGIRPESGVGGVAHRAQLRNVYDADADPLKLRSGDARGFESRVLDAGFSGYATRMEGSQPGQVIMLGEQSIQPEVLGPTSKIDNSARAPALRERQAPWQTFATGAAAEMRALLDRMLAKPSWDAYDLRVEDGALQYRDKEAVFAQRVQSAGKPVPVSVDAAANAQSAFDLANGQQFKTNRELKLALQERLLGALKAAKITLGDFNAGAEQYLVRVALVDAQIALQTNPNAVGWYNEKVTKALRLLALVHPEINTDPQAKFAFVWAMAVTSNGLKVDKNFELAEQAYATYKAAGKMPTDVQAGKAQAAINNGLALFNEMLAKHGFEALQSFMTTKATVKAIQSFSGLEVGGENLTTEVYGSAILGPKIGNGFFSNLYGRFEQLTMDRWLMRTWGRWTGTLIETNPEQVRAKRVQLRALIQALDKDQKKAFETVIKRKLTVGDPDDVALAIWKSSQKPINRARMLEVADATDAAGQARLAAIMGPLKKGQKRSSFGDELRKVGNSLTMYNDGQKEAPSGPPERGRIRKVFAQALAQLQEGYPALTMSDLQALLWYPEKRLYDAAKEAGEGETGYEDDAAPDYANAAAKLARGKGVSDEEIARAIDEVDDEIRTANSATAAGRTDRAEAPSAEAPAGGVREPGGVRGGAGLLEQQAGDLSETRQTRQTRQTGDRGGRYSSGGLAPLEGAPAVVGATGPDPRIVAAAEQYAADNGIELRRQGAYAEVDPARAARVAAAYAAMQHAPNDPAVKAAYADLARQTLAQYEALQRAGYKFWFMDPGADPYQGNPWNAMRDLRANQSMAVFPTEAGFGSGGQVNIGLADPNGGPNLDPATVLEALRVIGAEVEVSTIFASDTEPTLAVKVKKALTKEQGDFLSGLADQQAIAQRTDDEKGSLFGPMAEKWGPFNPTYFVTPTGVRADEIANPLLQDTGIAWAYGTPDGEQRPVMFNDLFRAVHDAFGHGMEGAGFRAQGEENAWQAHARLFTGPALGALTSETRGQNSWLNYGPNGEANQTAKVEDTVFADQKTGLMPEWTWTEGRVGDQADVLEQPADTPRGTFNPQSLELALNANADLSTFIHETGHFFLEVMADIASQPNAPAEITQDMQTLLAWFGVKGEDSDAPVFNAMDAWASMTLDEKRPYHERFAESIEQYVMEGKAPSAELQPLFRKFRAWVLNVYRSAKAFIDSRTGATEIQLSDEVRKVFDRMLASQEEIRQAEETAGMMPNQDATADAVEKLTARSLRDLAWTVRAVAKAVKALQRDAVEARKEVEAEVTAEVDAMHEMRAKAALDALQISPDFTAAAGMWREARAAALADTQAKLKADLYAANPDATGLKKGQLLAKNKRTLANTAEAAMIAWEQANPKPTKPENVTDADLAVIADSFGFADVDTMLTAIDAVGKRADLIEGMTDQRMLEQHGELVDEASIQAAANQAVHNEARARSLATELKAQAEMANPRTDTGQTNAAGSKITVNAIVEAAKQFAANVVAGTPLKDMKALAWKHTAAERRANTRWQQATMAGDTAAAVKAKQDQVLHNAAAKAAMDAMGEAKDILEFFRRVVKDGNEKTVEKGRDPDVVNAARAILAAYGVGVKGAKSALDYLGLVEKNDPAMFAALQPSLQGALNMAQPLNALTMEQLQGLHEEIQSMWHLAKRSRQMEVQGDLIDIDDAADELSTRMAAIGVPLEAAGTNSALTPAETRQRWLQFAGSLLRRTEQWAEGMDGKYGGPFLRLVFGPVKAAADAYRADRVIYRKAYQALVDAVAPALRKGLIQAPELGYTFGKGHNGIGHAELLHAILHTGNASNKRKLLLGRNWATENADGTMDTQKWDAFIQRMHDTGVLGQAHYDFAQGVWDLLERTKPLAQKAHRDVFGRYFSEVTADAFDTPFGNYRGGYVPAKADPRIVQEADLRSLAAQENESMSFNFPATNRGWAKNRVEYNRPLMLDLRAIGQHIDSVLLFAHMEAAGRDVNKLLSRKPVSQPLGKIDPTIYAGMLTPWLHRSMKQIVESPSVGDGGTSRVLSAARSRAGMALMFANISNTLQQVTGFAGAMAKLKADGMKSDLMKSTALYISGPKKMAAAVAAASPFMANRMANEIAMINDAMNEILLDPSIYEKAQAWSAKHAYFLQSAMDNTMGPIIWTAAYNAALGKSMSQADAARYADGVIRQTQGSTLPEDISRIEGGGVVSGHPLVRVFSQFIGYFNMVANTNGTQVKQIAMDVGLKKGAGKALGLVTLGMMVPVWVAVAIAEAMRGGPDDPDEDGWLDDWLMAVFGIGTIKGMLAMVPVAGQLVNAGINRFNGNPADDKLSLSPAISLLEAGVGVPVDIYKAITDEVKLRTMVRDVASAVSIATGLPAMAIARPLGYLAGVEQGQIEPTSAADAVRGAITGSASPDSKQ